MALSPLCLSWNIKHISKISRLNYKGVDKKKVINVFNRISDEDKKKIRIPLLRCLTHCKPSQLIVSGMLITENLANMLYHVIKNNPKLVSLDLNQNPLGDAGIEAIAPAIAGLTRLKSLLLWKMDFGPRGAKALAAALPGLLELEKLYLGKNHIGSEGAQALAPALAPLARLERVTFDHCDIDDGGAVALMRALKDKERLQFVYLFKNRIGDAGAAAIAAALSHKEALQDLPISSNSIGDRGIAEIARVVETTPHLLKLKIFANRFGPAGARAVAGLIPRNAHLKWLEVGSNRLGDEGCAAFARVVRRCSALETLTLPYTGMTRAGLAPIVDALCVHKSVRNMNLRGNLLRADALGELARAFGCFSHIEKIILSFNPLGDEGAEKLIEIFEATPGKIRTLLLSSCDISYESMVRVLTTFSKDPKIEGVSFGESAFTKQQVEHLNTIFRG
eukprot:gnl/Chilomastix_cuspidata/2983.p1 GENE.gnl/Chilomastix_cuspidata/2983~~gnl/Chilomastix_cuspidata/2983.p1  ORF type:complete len:449 (-),score=196.16 gnl/Chilomastix_cuspidata/2983:66-1412(-)